MKKILLTYLIMLAATTAALVAQDTVVLKSGEILNGQVSLQYAGRSDFAMLNGVKYLANDIDEINLEGGVSFYSREVTYYSRENKAESTKFAFLKKVLLGAVDLYSYNGRQFDIAISNGDEVRVLQNLPSMANTKDVFVYKVELVNAIGRCVDTKDIYDASLSLNKMTYLINLNNKCADDQYHPLVEAEEITKVKYVTGVYRTTVSNVSYDNVQIVAKDGLAIALVGQKYLDDRVSFREDQSKSSEVGFGLQGNIKASENFFWHTELSVRSYRLIMAAKDDLNYNIRMKYDDFTAINLSLGASYRKKLLGPISIELTGGYYHWFLSHGEITYLISNRRGISNDFESDINGRKGGGVFGSANVYLFPFKYGGIYFGVNQHFLGAESTNNERGQGRTSFGGGISIRLSKTGIF